MNANEAQCAAYETSGEYVIRCQKHRGHLSDHHGIGPTGGHGWTGPARQAAENRARAQAEARFYADRPESPPEGVCGEPYNMAAQLWCDLAEGHTERHCATTPNGSVQWDLAQPGRTA